MFNTRGGSLYLIPQFTTETIKGLFINDEPSLIRSIIITPHDKPAVKLGDINARFLHFTTGETLQGMVLRFVRLTEEQLDTINLLCMSSSIPEGANEEQLVLSVVKQNPEGL